MALRNRRTQTISTILAELLLTPNQAGQFYQEWFIDLGNPRCRLGRDDRIGLAALFEPTAYSSCHRLGVFDRIRVVDQAKGHDVDLVVVSRHGTAAVVELRNVMSASEAKALTKLAEAARDAQSAELREAFAAEAAKAEAAAS